MFATCLFSMRWVPSQVSQRTTSTSVENKQSMALSTQNKKEYTQKFKYKNSATSQNTRNSLNLHQKEKAGFVALNSNSTTQRIVVRQRNFQFKNTK